MRSLEELALTTEELVRIPSVSSDRQACHRALDYVVGQLPPDHGFWLETFEHEGYRSLVVSTRPGRRAGLILNAHLDVVWAPPEQFEPRREAGDLWGRGAYDMKGAAAVYVNLLKDLAEREQRPDVQFQFVTDEEIGGHRGAQQMVPAGYTAELMIAGEPTDLGICHRAKGVFWLSVALEGVAGHAARPWLTQNPIPALTQGLSRLLERFPTPREQVWQTTCAPTFVAAGNSHNRVPGQAQLKLDIRYVPDDSTEEILDFVRSAFPGGQVEVVQLADPLETSPEDPMVAKLARVYQELQGKPPRLFAEHFASDARYYSATGVPAVLWGPSGAGMHADDERLDLASLHTYYRMLHRLLEDF